VTTTEAERLLTKLDTALPAILSEVAAELRRLDRENDDLRETLAGLVGSSDPAELAQMEEAMSLLPAPEADKAAMLRAIRLLRASLGAAQERIPA
jgi:hypothetical protein